MKNASMKNTALLLSALLLAGCQTITAANFEARTFRTPIPCDSKLVAERIVDKPANNVPPEFAAFSGKWSGMAEGADPRCVAFSIEGINADGTLNLFFVFKDVSGKEDDVILPGNISKDGILYFRSTNVEFYGRMNGDTIEIIRVRPPYSNNWAMVRMK